MNEQQPQLCRICNQISVTEDTGFFSNKFQLVRCVNCGTVLVDVFQNRLNSSVVYNDLFSNDAVYKMHTIDYEKVISGHPPFSWRRTQMMNRVKKLTQGRDIIEIGGGTGVFGYFAVKDGWNYHDFDVSNIAVEFAKKLSLKAQLFDAQGVPPIKPASCDVVVMWEVIEHIWNLADYLETIRKGLRSDGVFVFSTPNFADNNYQASILRGSKSSSPPVHINFFTPLSLEKVLYKSGFKRVSLYMPRIKIPAKNYNSILSVIKTMLLLKEPETIFGVAQIK
jgi:SAM-dependent methyltransferase